ncbi:ATP-dependent DNA helicase Q5 [Mortierella sp. AD094]|nr:ATP-dependent DNA helicase Q5 [Mortierella sp. AD094]
MNNPKIQTQLTFKNHSGNTDTFQKEQQQRHASKAILDCHKCLRSVFRLKEFRGNQSAVVQAVLEGRDALVIMPTGGGKSLCYQLPAVMSKGVTVVVSPLLALIHDQATALLRLGIKAAALNSSVGKKERANVMADLNIDVPSLKLLYVTPELLATSDFRKLLIAMENRDMLARLVIDEGSTGYQSDPWLTGPSSAALVRFNYDDKYENFLGFLRGVYKSRKKRHQVEFNKSTVPTPSSIQEIEPVCGIIYCGQRLMCEELANRLVDDGIMAAAFHSGMTPKQRASVQQRWCSDASYAVAAKGNSKEKPIDVIVATIAFGMGIDKPNVRFICHWELPKTIEGYYQESGRAGRDGDISRCILYYSREDRAKIEFLLEVEKERRRIKNREGNIQTLNQQRSPAMDPVQTFQKMVAYCENVSQCRHVFLCEYFGETGVRKDVVCKDGVRCDICRTPEKVAKEKADNLSDIHRVGHLAQHMGGSKTVIGSDGHVQVQGSWQSASVALGRYDPDLMGDEDRDAKDSDMSSSDSDEDSDEAGSTLEDEDQDPEAVRKAKRRKLLFGNSVEPSYYEKLAAPPKTSIEHIQAITANKYGLSHIESTKVELKFRELCYETVERSLISLLQGAHKSLTAEYFSRFGAEQEQLSKSEVDARLARFAKTLALEIERNGFESSGTANTYRTVLGHRVRDIKGFETQARLGLAALSTTASGSCQTSTAISQPAEASTAPKEQPNATSASAKSQNQAWATAVQAWESKGRTAQTENFSLRSWIRHAPWSQYFKSGCRLIVKSPLNFFIFFCCLSVVVWGAFLVLLMANIVKLADDATQKLWIEIASQVLNGFFTLANVPVHPKRFLGYIRGLRIWREDNATRQQFLSRFLEDHMEWRADEGLTKEEHAQELLRMLDFYRCFPEYGHSRIIEKFSVGGSQGRIPSSVHPFNQPESLVPTTASSVASPSKSHSKSSLDLNAAEDQRDASNNFESATLLEPSDSIAPTPSEGSMRVGIAEEDLHGLLAEETDRVVQSVVLPFLPFPMGTSNTTLPRDRRLSLDVEAPIQEMELSESSSMSQKSPISPQSRRTLDRGSSYASLSKMPTKRTMPRTRARTMSMSIAKEAESPTFVIHEGHRMPRGSPGRDPGGNVSDFMKEVEGSSSKKGKSPPPLIPMPLALTREQMDWIDGRQVRLLQLQSNLQKGWPWYHYTIPDGIEPVDFFATRSEVELASSVPDGTVMFSSSPSDLVIRPSRFCLIVGSFNINSFVQEILCGFMWGMNYHVRPGWVVGTGMAVGCLAAIIPSVLIMLHGNAMSQVRVVATTEEAIQDALDVKEVGVDTGVKQ